MWLADRQHAHPRDATIVIFYSPIIMKKKNTSAKQLAATRRSAGPIRAAVVGLGRAGWTLHLQPMFNHGGFQVVGVVDPLAERCREAVELTACQVFSSLPELLNKSDAELVVVATPSHTHFADIRKVLLSSRHCIAEKPLAFSTQEATELVALARRKRRKLFVHHAHLHAPPYNHLRSIVDSGKLGPIFSIQASWASYARRWDWQTLKKFRGGQLNNTCPHMLSIILPLLGSKVVSVYANLRNIKDVGDAEDHVHLVLETETGISANIISSGALAISGPQWILAGKYGACSFDGKTSHLRYYDPAKAPQLKVIEGAAPNRQYLREQLPWIEENIEAGSGNCPSFHENVHTVLTAGARQIVTPESAADVVRVTEMAAKAAAKRIKTKRPLRQSARRNK